MTEMRNPTQDTCVYVNDERTYSTFSAHNADSIKYGSWQKFPASEDTEAFRCRNITIRTTHGETIVISIFKDIEVTS